MADIDEDGLMDLLIGNYNLASSNVLRYEQTNNAAPTPLPVTLTAFTATASPVGNQLRWNTAQEINSARFVVERSADGKTYQAVATLTAAGTSSSARTYQYLDAATSLPTAYYRLRAEDLDGTFAYSSVVVVRRAPAAATLTAFPNPFENELLVALPAGAETQPATVTLSTLAGQQVYRSQQALSAVAQPLPGLPTLKTGVYVLRLTTAAGTTTQRVVRR